MDLRYPIGQYDFPKSLTADQRARCIEDIEQAPARYREAVRGLSDEQLDTPYREGGWTVRQVIHHVPESHMNSFIRFKLALTENEPTVKPYDETAWARTPDAQMAIEPSLRLLEALHQRWVVLLRSLGDAEFARSFRHPEIGLVRLDANLGLYSWHCRHHAAHITGLRQRMGWK
jgi:uncharacterized damage-inducible protein DinB